MFVKYATLAVCSWVLQAIFPPITSVPTTAANVQLGNVTKQQYAKVLQLCGVVPAIWALARCQAILRVFLVFRLKPGHLLAQFYHVLLQQQQ